MSGENNKEFSLKERREEFLQVATQIYAAMYPCAKDGVVNMDQVIYSTLEIITAADEYYKTVLLSLRKFEKKTSPE